MKKFSNVAQKKSSTFSRNNVRSQLFSPLLFFIREEEKFYFCYIYLVMGIVRKWIQKLWLLFVSVMQSTIQFSFITALYFDESLKFVVL